MRLQLLRRYLTSKDMWRVLLLAAAAATGVRDPLPSRIYWLHIPKCGSSFANTVVHWACDDVALNKSVSAFLGATPIMIVGEKCPRLHKNHSKHWGRHKDLGYFARDALREVLAAPH